MKTQEYTITCTRNEPIAKGIYEMSFTKPPGFTFNPGQFVLFDIPLIDQPENIQTRALSIASTPDEPELLFIAKIQPGGRISRWIEEKLQPGKEALMKGPFGFFTFTHDADRDALMIATSTGIAPFRSMLTGALNSPRRIDLIFGVRSEEDLFWQQVLERRAQQHENFFLHIALSSPSEQWKGHRGRVQTLAPLIVHNDFTMKSVYACGSPAMTKDIKRMCLEEWGVEKKNVHVEGYI